ncbi:MAG: hypothetical protein RL173_31 [Fibrobacterota bacterium]|jgi:hypothetical protein
MQPYKAPPAYIKCLTPLDVGGKSSAFDSICLNCVDHDILAVHGSPVHPADERGLAYVTWKGSSREPRGYVLRSGRLVHDGEILGWKQGLVPFSGTVIVGIRPREDDMYPGYLLHALGCPPECLQLDFVEGQLKAKEPCEPMCVYVYRQPDGEHADDEWRTGLLAMTLRQGRLDGCDCFLTEGPDVITGRQLDRLLALMLKILANESLNVHPYRLFSQLIVGLREGPPSPCAPRIWTRWHQQLHEAFDHGCGCLRALEKQ